MSKYNKVSQSPLKSPDQNARASILMPPTNDFIELSTPQRTSRKNGLFSNDQELLFNFNSPLIMISENNNFTPSCRPSGRFIPPSNHRTINDENLETDSRKSDGLGSKPRLSVWSNGGEDSSAPSARRARLSQSQISNSQVLQKARAAVAAGESPEKGDKSMMENSRDVDIFKTEDDEKPKEENPFKLIIRKTLDNLVVNIVLGVFIFYTLFASDFSDLVLTEKVDMGFDVVSLIAMGAFTIEIACTLIVQKDYLWSFFFWLDVISTVSIIFDVTFISSDVFPDGTANTAQLARASRASRIGTRAGRVVRIFRLVRLAKLYKQVEKNQKDKLALQRAQSLDILSADHEPDNIRIDAAKVVPADSNFLVKKPTLRTLQTLRHSKTMKASLQRAQSMAPEVGEDGELKESRVGKKLSDLTTKRVIIIVLAMLLIVPLFTTDFYFDSPDSQNFQVNLISTMINNGSVSNSTIQTLINAYISQQSTNQPKLIYLKIGDTLYYPNSDTASSDIVDPESLRDEEKESGETTSNFGDIYSVSDQRSSTKLEAGLNLLRTVFVCAILMLGALFFSRDANTLVLRPIERMIEKVNKIAKDPLIAKDQSLVRDKNAGLENETVQIENAIIKIGGLLALGYGDAGSAIVTQNMARSGDLNPMLPGRKELAIFGFCDIRNFTDATEVLQKDVMVFVNSIAEVVHSVVDLHTGAANKNIGDAFLLVWKFPDSEVMENYDASIELRDSKLTQAMADLALLSFIKINIKINRDPVLLAYRSNPALNARLPNYQVKMGFGLHVGWAIEGAIGSEFKVDASYLSPNVNLASRLEAATKQYGVPLLFSGELYSKLSRGMKQKCRLIDIITVKGSIMPMEVYTVDMDLTEMLPLDKPDLTTIERRELHKLRKKQLWEDIMERNSAYILENDKELLHVFRNHNLEFNDIFEEGFRGYIQGDWAIAKKKFEQCLSIHNEDGPTKNLLEFLKEHDYISPEDWKGYHVLTEK